MQPTTRTRVRRALIPLAALAVAAAIVPTAGAADCTVAPNADCSGQDMRHLGDVMHGANMRGANLSGANMAGMDLSGMNLAGANLSGANVSGAKMGGANMTGADMRGMTMRKVTMKGAKLMKANLAGSTIIGGNWSKAKLMHAKLGAITVSNTNLSHADFSGATTQLSKGAKALHAPTLRAATAQTWGYFTGVDFSYTQWDGATIQNAMFANRSNFHWAEIKNSDFSGSQFVDANYFETIGIRDSNLNSTRYYGNIYMPAFVARTSFDNIVCRFVSVPNDRQVIGTTHSTGAYFSGQNARGQGQLTYGPWTLITPTYDFYFVYSLPANGITNAQSVATATSAANLDAWNGGCKIVGVNAA